MRVILSSVTGKSSRPLLLLRAEELRSLDDGHWLVVDVDQLVLEKQIRLFVFGHLHFVAIDVVGLSMWAFVPI